MKKVDEPIAKLSNYAGMWVAIQDHRRIVAVADEFDDLKPLVSGTKKYPPKASAFRVPTKKEMKAPWGTVKEK